MSQQQIYNIENLITLLNQYKKQISNNDNSTQESYLKTLIENDIYNLTDKIYFFYSNQQTNIVDPEIISEINDYKTNMQNIKELYPIIINYLLYKNS